jgi:hypothetical protein
MNSDKEEYILCAAVYYIDGEIYPHQPAGILSGFVISGHRHHNILSLLHILCPGKKNIIQGFLTSENRFVDRNEARQIAWESGQSDRKIGMLFSEDLY